MTVGTLADAKQTRELFLMIKTEKVCELSCGIQDGKNVKSHQRWRDKKTHSCSIRNDESCSINLSIISEAKKSISRLLFFSHSSKENFHIINVEVVGSGKEETRLLFYFSFFFGSNLHMKGLKDYFWKAGEEMADILDGWRDGAILSDFTQQTRNDDCLGSTKSPFKACNFKTLNCCIISKL